MDREKAAELAKTLDASPDLAADDAADLGKLTTPLEEISDRLGSMSGELGVTGKVADAADAQILEIVRRLKAHADVVVDASAVVQSAAASLSRAQTDYYDLPSGRLSSWERREYEDAGAGPGITYIEQARAQQRETEADKALTTLTNDLNTQIAQMKDLSVRVEEYRVPEDDGDTPGGRTPSTLPPGPGSRGPGGGNPPGSAPGWSPPSGGFHGPDTGGPTDPGRPDPDDPRPPTDPNPHHPDPSDPDPSGPDPTDPGTGPGDGPGGPGDVDTPPWQYGDGDVHSDGPGGGTPYGPGPIGGPGPNAGGGLGNGGVGNGTFPGGTAPGGGAVGGALAGGLAVGGTALGAVGGSRLAGGAGGVGAPTGTLGGGAVMAGPMGGSVGGAGAAGGAAAGRPGAAGMVGGGGAGGAGGAGSSSKKKRAGSLGYLAPELEDEESPVGRAAGMRRGSREDRPDVVTMPTDDDETW